MFLENGDIQYKGEFKENEIEGKGTSFDSSGNMEYDGYWENG